MYICPLGGDYIFPVYHLEGFFIDNYFFWFVFWYLLAHFVLFLDNWKKKNRLEMKLCLF